MEEEILEALKCLNQKIDTLSSQVHENAQLLKQFNSTKSSGSLIQRTSADKIKVSVKSRVRNTSGTEDKRIIVKVDYDPKEDFAILAFERKMRKIWWF